MDFKNKNYVLNEMFYIVVINMSLGFSAVIETGKLHPYDYTGISGTVVMYKNCYGVYNESFLPMTKRENRTCEKWDMSGQIANFIWFFKKMVMAIKSKLGQDTGRLKPVNPPAKQRAAGVKPPNNQQLLTL